MATTDAAAPRRGSHRFVSQAADVSDAPRSDMERLDWLLNEARDEQLIGDETSDFLDTVLISFGWREDTTGRAAIDAAMDATSS